MGISIHTLTWRVTLPYNGPRLFCSFISIHTLTWRVTSPAGATAGLSENFNPHPHVEGDRYNRPYTIFAPFISIHTLTWRVT